MHVQKKKRYAKRSRNVAKREILRTGDPAEAPAKKSAHGRSGGSIAKTKNPLTRYFAVALSKIKRKPSSVSCEFVSVMVLDALATRTARPPVATTGAV